MGIKNHRDFWAGVAFLVVGLGFAWGSTNYSFGASARPGPGYFPFGLGLVMAFLGSFEIFKAFAFEADDDGTIGDIAWKPLLTIVGAVVVFGIALPLLGLFIALPLLIAMSSWAGDEFRWRDVILTSLLLTAGSWAAFDYGLGLTIPLWPAFL